MYYPKKLIEVALPLEAINAESVREKSIRHGHPSTLHLWWARRPLAAARAVIWSSLVDDPSSHPDEFPTDEAQAKERQRLFAILEELVKWENSNNHDILEKAKAAIMKSTGGNPPALLDPFAGGGSIPLEAQRLGLEAHASDLNPVAVMINKAMIEIPPKFANQPPVNPSSGGHTMWTGATGLAEDVRYYGEWMKKMAFNKIGHLYPSVKFDNGEEHAVIAWIWTRTVKCPNPACGCEMPLASSFVLSKKKGNETYIQPVIEGKNISYEVKYGTNELESPKGSRASMFRCIICHEPATLEYVKQEAKYHRMSSSLMAIVAEGNSGRLYVSPTDKHIMIGKVVKPDNYPTQELAKDKRDIKSQLYGLDTFDKLFTNRQLTALTTFSDLICMAQEKIETDGGSKEYAQSIIVYLAFVVDKLADYNSSICSWHNSRETIRNIFGRQAIPMVWDFAEANPFCSSTGSFGNMLDWVVKVIEKLPANMIGIASQHDAQTDIKLSNIIISTDPPYYDNVNYSVLSDFFYVWLRQALKASYPDIFSTMLVPKTEELVASPYRFGGSVIKARHFFEEGMLHAFKQIYVYSTENIPVTVYYAYKQSEGDTGEMVASTGWETMLSAIILAGFSITGTWPMRTELSNRILSRETNALASSIVLVCRKRPVDAPICSRRDFVNTLKRELNPALAKLLASNIAPVDLAQSAIGPGMGVYSRFSKILEADGDTMSVRSALQIINQELDLYFTTQDGELDSDSRFCVDLYSQYAFNDVKFGEADVLARAKNTSVEKLRERGILFAHKGVVRLLTREEIQQIKDDHRPVIWLLTQRLTCALQQEGILGSAKIVAYILTSEPEQAKALAYRLYTTAERKNWAAEAFAYNSLVVEWPNVLSKAAELRSRKGIAKQGTLF
jgi:putative DNA methylase